MGRHPQDHPERVGRATWPSMRIGLARQSRRAVDRLAQLDRSRC